ncbi:13203_t:CDS:2 [Funneliformis geosporum]|uniref:13203_t:CDS:1 n=1 Tax=Funneliformis geosporum TaxID=1117311 RepID=A0A9W4X0L5_9GLOM|nr:13203_t:CDS:2 [Funneliformis geosporum]
MFEYMLKNEQIINPCKLAFDRPSDKFRSFLKKHYNLENFVQQPNNFVVFDEYGLPDIPTNLHLLNKTLTRRHSSEINLLSNEKTPPSGTYHRHTRSLTPNHHYYTSKRELISQQEHGKQSLYEQINQDAPPPPYTPPPEQAGGSSNTNTSVVTSEGVATEQTRLNSKPTQSYTVTKTYSPTPNLTYSPPTNRGVYQPPETVVLTAAVPLEALRTEPVVTTCPHCRQVVLSSVRFEIGGCTWLTSFALFFLGFGGGCCLIPFCITDMKDSYHSCPNCGKIMAKYSRLDGKVFRYRG